MIMTIEELAEIIAKHKKWVDGEEGGTRADLTKADLTGAILTKADLTDAILTGSNLTGSILTKADLTGAILTGSDLTGSNLTRAILTGSDLTDAILTDAILTGAILTGANLTGANNASTAFAMTSITPEGDLIGYKKCQTEDGKHCIVKLKIPTDAKRSNASGRKCRAEWAEVLEVDGAAVGVSKHDGLFRYIAGQKVVSDKWDDNRWNECSSGIHFFITRAEAEDYDL